MKRMACGLLIASLFAVSVRAEDAPEIVQDAVEVIVDDPVVNDLSTDEIISDEVVPEERYVIDGLVDDVVVDDVVVDDVVVDDGLEIGIEVDDQELIEDGPIDELITNDDGVIFETFKDDAPNDGELSLHPFDPLVCEIEPLFPVVCGMGPDRFHSHEGPEGEVVPCFDPHIIYSMCDGGGPEYLSLTERGDIQPNFRGLEVAANGLSSDLMSSNSLSNDSLISAHRTNLSENVLRNRNSAFDSLRPEIASEATRAQRTSMMSRVFGREQSQPSASSKDRTYAANLAKIDEMRDQALATGDKELLRQADLREQELKTPVRKFRLFGR